MSHRTISMRLDAALGRDSTSGAAPSRHALSSMRQTIGASFKSKAKIRIQYRCGKRKCLNAETITVRSFAKDIVTSECGLQIRLVDVDRIDTITQ